MACSAALRWMASATISCARTAGCFPGLGLQALDHVGGVAPRFALQLPQQQLACFVGAQAGHALELALAFRDELLALGRARRHRFFPRRQGAFAAAEILLEPVGCGQAVGEGARLVRELLFEREHLLASFTHALVGLGGDGVRLFACLDGGFLAQRVGVALGLFQERLGVELGLRQQLALMRSSVARSSARSLLNWRGRRDRELRG